MHDSTAAASAGRRPLDIALHAAALAADAAEVTRLLAAGADPLSRDEKRDETPLHAACRSDASGDCCRALLSAPNGAAAADMRCVHGGNVLHQAGQFLRESALRAVLEAVPSASASANLQDKNGWTPLHATLYKPAPNGFDRRGMVALLMASGADLTLPNKDGRTPRELALAFGHADAIAALPSE